MFFKLFLIIFEIIIDVRYDILIYTCTSMKGHSIVSFFLKLFNIDRLIYFIKYVTIKKNVEWMIINIHCDL